MSIPIRGASRKGTFFGVVLAVFSLLLVIIVFGGAYYFIIQPQLIKKPFMEKPGLSEQALELAGRNYLVLNSSHFSYLANEIGAYKLKGGLVSKDTPEIEFVLTDVGASFSVFVEENVPSGVRGKAVNPDIKIKGRQLIAIEVLESRDILKAVRAQLDKNALEVELLKDMRVLADKGYLALWDTIR
ncbi:hypothetical protein HYV84_07820 [Candidatus Woesearchaeota archaeon]|nr:hypothetical protein [Candidatus Woesearchaeota archaeon]